MKVPRNSNSPKIQLLVQFSLAMVWLLYSIFLSGFSHLATCFLIFLFLYFYQETKLLIIITFLPSAYHNLTPHTPDRYYLCFSHLPPFISIN